MPSSPYRRAVVLVLDGFGVGAAPDAAAFGDVGADTFANAVAAAGGITLPNLRRLGLGCIHTVPGLGPADAPTASFGRMRETSPAKDTISGHWEMMACPVEEPFAVFPGGFPEEIVREFCEEAGVAGVLGNRAASGTEILEDLAEEHERTALPILYTSADSVFQLAAHLDVVPLDRLYAWCESARRLLDAHRVGRVIARPFRGRAGSYVRTYDRRDFSMAPPGETVLDRLAAKGIAAVGVGKISDIFSGRGLSASVHTEGNRDGMAATVGLLADLEGGLVLVNLVDTDMLYGHRRDPVGFVRCLEEFDEDLGVLLEHLREGDLLAISADHGCDPTFAKTTDHTREEVPLLLFDAARRCGVDLGVRETFADLGATVSEALGAGTPASGRSLLPSLAAA